MDSNGPKHLDYTLTREKLDSICSDLVERTIDPLKKCLKDSGFGKYEIDEVLLVGGSTRMPKVGEVVKDFFGKEPNRSVNPDEAVATGAAIQGAVLSGTMKDIILIDVTPLSLGTEIVGDVFSRIIPRNTPIPASMSKEYTTVSDN